MMIISAIRGSYCLRTEKQTDVSNLMGAFLQHVRNMPQKKRGTKFDRPVLKTLTQGL